MQLVVGAAALVEQDGDVPGEGAAVRILGGETHGGRHGLGSADGLQHGGSWHTVMSTADRNKS